MLLLRFLLSSKTFTGSSEADNDIADPILFVFFMRPYTWYDRTFNIKN